MSTKDNNPHSDKNLQLVKTGGSPVTQEVQRANRQLALAGRIGTQLVLNDERRRWVDLLSSIKAEDAVIFLSRRASLSLDSLERYKDHWKWDALSTNKSMSWSPELLEHFEDCWMWWDIDEPIGLSNNDSLPWSLELLERFKDRWEWGNFHPTLVASGVSTLKTLPWSLDLLERFKDRWDWVHLSNNNTLPWSLELIECFEDQWTWRETILNSKGNHERYGLSENRALPWSIELLERFEDRWSWLSLSANESLPWSIELLARFKDRWDWSVLSSHQLLPWEELLRLFDSFQKYTGTPIPECYWRKWLDDPCASRELLESYKSQWDWYIWPESQMYDDFRENGMSESEGKVWLERFIDKWDWDELSQTTSIVFEADAFPWTANLFDGENYKELEKLETNLLLGISLSETASWSMELLERIDEHFDVERYCKELYLEEDSWEAERFSKAQEEIWERLSLNKSLPWSKELTEQFTYLRNSWEQQPIVWSIEKFKRIEEDWDWDSKYDQYREQMWDLGYSVEQKGCWIWKRLSWEESLPWSIQLLEHFEDRWDWSSLSWNKSLPWSVELIERFSDRWNWGALSQNTSFQKLPLTTQDVDNIMRNIVSNE